MATRPAALLQATDKNATITVMTNLSSRAYKGARDYYPEDWRIQNYIFSIWRKVSEKYGYEEYNAPLLEPVEIYAAKSGQELVNEQTYAFTDRGDRQVAIRPEMTPTVSRMVAARRQELAYPARLYSIANFMRYERPQKGRDREFWQLNLDIFGDDSLAAEAEMVLITNDIMREFGAKSSDYVIKVNHRGLVDLITTKYLGLDSDSALAMTKLLDRKAKIPAEDFKAQAIEILGEDLSKLQTLLEAKNISDLPSEITENDAARQMEALIENLVSAGIENLEFDVTLMRGLDYYTGMVFEVFDTHPDNNRSLFGGGRYDGLVGVFGVEPVSAVGVAPGSVTVQNFLELHNLLPDLKSTTDVYFITLNDIGDKAAQIVAKLRSGGIKVEQDFTDRKLDTKIKSATKKKIPYVLFMGSKEADSGLYTIKDMAEFKEYNLDFDQMTDLIRSRR